MSQDLIQESHRQLQGAWAYFATSLPGGKSFRGRGVFFADGQSVLPFMNMAILTEPVDGADDLRSRVDEASAYFRGQKLHWMLTASEDALGSLGSDGLAAAAGAAGLQYLMPMEGMVASRLKAPLRDLPTLGFRSVTDAETRQAVSNLNALGYDVPTDMMAAAVAVPELWTSMDGIVAYADEAPASTASVVPIDGIAYVALVATHPGQQKRGCAEAVMRQALARARDSHGCERTVLHATPAGRPVYTRMGYDDVVTYHVYMGE